MATVSVVIPAYNYGRYLPTALESLRAQSCQDWECVVVDDGSTDDTAVIAGMASAADPRIRCVSQQNAGPSAARNRGFRESRGRYIQFLDADDVLPPTKLEAHIEILSHDLSVGIVYSDACFFEGTGGGALAYRVPGDRPSSGPPDSRNDPVLRALVHDNIMVVEGPLIRRSVLEEVGEFDERLTRMEDWHYWLRCALAGVRFVADPLEDHAVRVRVHAGSSARNEVAMRWSSVLVRRWLRQQLREPELRDDNEARIQENLARIGVLEAKEGQLATGLRRILVAGLESRRIDWLMLACALPLLRAPGHDRLLALRRRLLDRAGPS